MPELPEVEILARHLAPLIAGRTIRGVAVRRARVLRPTTPAELERALTGARFESLERRAKFLLFRLRGRNGREVSLLGHLGMTGRMFLQRAAAPLPKHAAVVLQLDRGRFVFEDTRYFGRFTLDWRALKQLGPEPLEEEFTAAHLERELRRSKQSVKVRLLDQSLVAGVGNIYASEALWRARIAPALSARRVTTAQVQRLWRAIRAVLREAIRGGSTLPLNFGGSGAGDGLFYFGRAEGAPDFYAERLRVYDRAGKPCARCRASIRRLVQTGRSTFFCPRCQA